MKIIERIFERENTNEEEGDEGDLLERDKFDQLKEKEWSFLIEMFQ